MSNEEVELNEDEKQLIDMTEDLLKNMEVIMGQTEKVGQQIKKTNPEFLHVKQKDIEFNMLSQATLISIIKDLQHIGIDGKNPKNVLKELKKLRKSQVPETAQKLDSKIANDIKNTINQIK